MQVREIMSQDIEVVDRNDNLLAVEERMATKQLRHLPVLEQGDIVGIVTQRDLSKPPCPPPWVMAKKHRRPISKVSV